MAARDRILSKLRAARDAGTFDKRLLEGAAPPPDEYLPVTVIEDTSEDGLIERFCAELKRLSGEPHVVGDEAAAREQIVALLRDNGVQQMIAWDFAQIPVSGLGEAIRAARIEVLHPDTHDEFRAETLSTAETAQISLTSADYAAAGTGTLIFTAAPGRGRIPTVLAPIHLAVIRAAQIVPRVEDWVKRMRADDLAAIRRSANVCFVSGPSRTGDIEMELILGVHGPGRLIVVIIRS
jgi:L-lactate dehydrogenase complex protein LldG